MTDDALFPATDEYTDAELQRLLAEDLRVAELGIDVTTRGEVVIVSGQVESQQRRDAIEHLVTEHLLARCRPCRLVNEIVVVPADPPVRAEELR